MEPRPPFSDGLILLDKPAGLTSHDCVARVRKLCPRKTKVGHAGTLDPFSTGLLVLLLGRGTRLAPHVQGMSKTYEGVLRFGEGTDTFDRDGRAVVTGPAPEMSEESWQGVANAFVGPSMQVPPDYSAKRIGGQRAYDLARQGLAISLDPRPVEIFSFEVHPAPPTDLRFRVSCSSGTYIRALARDMGERVGSPTHCLELRRTAVGPFGIDMANPLDDPLAGRGFTPFDVIDLGLPVHAVNHREERLLLNGQKVPAPLNLLGMGDTVKVVGPTGRFVALARIEGRQLRPSTVFAALPASQPPAGGASWPEAP